MNPYMDEEAIKKAISLLIAPDAVFEIRVIKGKQNWSGYFKSAEQAVDSLRTLNLAGKNVYITLQGLKKECYAMEQRDKLMQYMTATGDKDVVAYRWLFIDLDPERKTGISSTDAELQEAFSMAKRIYIYLREHGFHEPVKAISGNGAHLLYRISLENTDENKELVRKCLYALDALFGDDVVKIDVSNHNQSRICKLYGTLAQKGSNTQDRPHRMSRITYIPESIEINEKALLTWLAGQCPQTEELSISKAYTKQQGQFNIETWMQKYGLRYTAKNWREGAVKYVLEECPFNHEHRYPDSCIIRFSNGAIAFVCKHNSCQGRKWKDVRLMYEPDAYDYADKADWQIETGWQRKQNKDRNSEPKLDVNEPAEDIPKWLELNCESVKNEPVAEYIATGIPEIDKRLNGLKKGAVTVLSGLRGSAKSTFLGQLMINMVDNRQTVICFSGELSYRSFSNWLYLQASGKKHVKQGYRQNSYYVDFETKKKIDAWASGKFYLFNNKYGNRFSMLAQEFRSEAEKVKADCIVLDNLMAVDLDAGKTDIYEAQKAFVWELKNIATQTNTHVIFVAHPRKTTGFLRLNDISGSGNIGNIVDSAFIIHRKNNDFDKAFAEYFKGNKKKYVPDDCTNVLEICKDRENGTQDLFIPLWYEPETKRLLPDPYAVINYGWITESVQADEAESQPW